MKNQQTSVSENLSHALKTCRMLSVNGLVDLALLMSKHPDSEDTRVWASAIALSVEYKCPSPGLKFSLN